MSPLRLAVLNLSRRPIPTFIAVLAIAASVACSGILLRLNNLSANRFASFGQGGDALVGAKSGGIEMLLSALNGEGAYPGFLPYKLYESLHAEQAVHFEDGANTRPSFIRDIIPFVYFGKLDQFRAVGTDQDFFARPDAVDALHLKSGDWIQQAGDAILGSQVAHVKSLSVGSTLDVNPWSPAGLANSTQPLHVKGILNSCHCAWDRMIFTDVTTAHAILSTQDLSRSSIWGANVLNYFLVYVHPGGFAELSSLVNRRTVGEAVLISEQKDRLRALSGTGETIGLFVTVLILALGALSVTSMLITRFEAMSLQLAVLRAIGYPKRVLASWLLWEGFLLGVAACAVGLILDAMGFPLMRSLLGDALPPPDVVSSSLLQSFPIWITAILATTASVFVPLYRVYRQDVHFSLRS